MINVLLVEDEPAYVDALEVALGQDGFAVHSATDGRTALRDFARLNPDVVLLDLMLPELPGLDVLRIIRETSTTPVIVVSAKDREADVVAALELGADDYVRKPYSVRELVARIRAAARRAGPADEAPETIRMGDVALDTARYELRAGEEIFLVVTWTVILSVLLHGLTSVWLSERYGQWYVIHRRSHMPEATAVEEMPTR